MRYQAYGSAGATQKESIHGTHKAQEGGIQHTPLNASALSDVKREHYDEGKKRNKSEGRLNGRALGLQRRQQWPPSDRDHLNKPLALQAVLARISRHLGARCLAFCCKAIGPLLRHRSPSWWTGCTKARGK